MGPSMSNSGVSFDSILTLDGESDSPQSYGTPPLVLRAVVLGRDEHSLFHGCIFLERGQHSLQGVLVESIVRPLNSSGHTFREHL